MMRQHGGIAAGWAVCGLGLLLAGCSGWSYNPPIAGDPITKGSNLSSLRARTPQSPASFNQSLTSDYASFATALNQEHGDWKDVDYFARKGLAASNGQVVPPEDNRNWLVPLEVPEKFRTQLADGRQRLVTALDGGGRARAPAAAARAQVSYDCWVERMEDDWKTAAEGPCHQQFLAALAQLERPVAAVNPSAGTAIPPAGEREYRIYFDFDRASLTPEGQQLVRRIAEQAKQQGNAHIVSIGKADLAGSDQYNMKLSQRRADTVHDALVREGVPPGQIENRWVGERQPPVPTAPGTRESRNRVVEVTLQ